MKTEATATETPAETTAAAPATKKASKKAAKSAAKKRAKSVAPNKAAKPASKPAAKNETKSATNTSVPRDFSKKAAVIDLLRRKDGATVTEIAKATNWQNHSIRGFISGQITKKMGLIVESSKNEAGERTYRITK